MSAEDVVKKGAPALLIGAPVLWYIVETGAGDKEVFMPCSSGGCHLLAMCVVDGDAYCLPHGLIIQIVKLAANDN